MRVEKVSFQEWNRLAEDAHKVAFGEARPASMNTFDFAVVGFDENQILGYATIIEFDRETAYMQHGGAMPGVKDTALSFATYSKIMEFVKANYRRITTRIQNTNIPMLKFAMKQGLLVHGVDYYPGEIYLHLRWERENVKP